MKLIGSISSFNLIPKIDLPLNSFNSIYYFYSSAILKANETFREAIIDVCDYSVLSEITDNIEGLCATIVAFYLILFIYSSIFIIFF